MCASKVDEFVLDWPNDAEHGMLCARDLQQLLKFHFPIGLLPEVSARRLKPIPEGLSFLYDSDLLGGAPMLDTCPNQFFERPAVGGSPVLASDVTSQDEMMSFQLLHRRSDGSIAQATDYNKK